MDRDRTGSTPGPDRIDTGTAGRRADQQVVPDSLEPPLHQHPVMTKHETTKLTSKKPAYDKYHNRISQKRWQAKLSGRRRLT
ncbi:unnamed protein product, partial [Brenthis ino]